MRNSPGSPSTGRRGSSAQLNDLHVKAVKLQGEFVWHSHATTDELFFVHKGTLTIRLRDRDVVLKPGEMFVVPKGVEHMPVASEECEILLIEPAGTVNTCNVRDERTRIDVEAI